MADNLIPFLERLHTDPDVQAQSVPFAGALHVVAAQFAALSTAIGLPTSAEALEVAATEAAQDLARERTETTPGPDGAVQPTWHGGSFAAASGAALIAAASQREAAASPPVRNPEPEV